MVRGLAASVLGAVVLAFGCSDSGDSLDGETGGSGGSAANDGGGGSSGRVGAGGAAAAGGSSAGGSSAGGSSAGGSSAGGSSATGGAGGSSATGGAGGSSATGGAGGSAAAGGSSASGGSGGCVPANCQNHTYACGNCLDDDGDGKTDMADPDCLGPCHNAEDTYFGSIPGQSGPACTVDCYFDQDSGAGNDDCHWNHRCDKLSVAPKYPPEGDPKCEYDANANTPGTSGSCDEIYNTQTDACLDFCGPLVPNGCDCFGCCELPAHSGKTVWLGSEDASGGICTLADVGDVDKCRPCTQVKGCLNTCEHCELCLGKTVLPADCIPTGSGGAGGSGTGGSGTGGSGGSGTGGSGTGGSTGGSGGSGGNCGGQLCPPGRAACGLACQPPCPAGEFCLTGCCANVPQ